MATYSSNDDSNKYLTETDTRAIARAIAQQELKKESKELRKEFITIFGLFAAFITFTVLQIQAFIQAEKMSLIMGAASFFAAISLTFVITLNDLINDRTAWKDILKPTYVLVLIIYVFSGLCFWYAIK